MGKLAALSSGLLARKGQARPAMRPQAFVPTPAALDDLGWNDMGIAPQPEPAAPPEPAPRPLPPVLMERAVLEATVAPAAPAPSAPAPAGESARRPVSVATAERIRRETGQATAKGKAAFTLRLESERHLRLRLASAIAGRSAQALMVDALDAFLLTVPEVEQLVEQLPPAKRRARRGR